MRPRLPMSDALLQQRVNDLVRQLYCLLAEANYRGLIIERLVETDAGGGKVLMQQHLTMPTDQAIPEVKFTLWRKVSDGAAEYQPGSD